MRWFTPLTVNSTARPKATTTTPIDSQVPSELISFDAEPSEPLTDWASASWVDTVADGSALVSAEATVDTWFESEACTRISLILSVLSDSACAVFSGRYTSVMLLDELDVTMPTTLTSLLATEMVPPTATLCWLA